MDLNTNTTIAPINNVRVNTNMPITPTLNTFNFQNSPNSPNLSLNTISPLKHSQNIIVPSTTQTTQNINTFNNNISPNKSVYTNLNTNTTITPINDVRANTNIYANTANQNIKPNTFIQGINPVQSNNSIRETNTVMGDSGNYYYSDGLFTISPYSDKSIVLRSNKETILPYTKYLSEIGGKYNTRLTGGPGWIFTNKLYPNILNIIKSINNKTLEQIPVESKYSRKERPSEIKLNKSSNDGYQIIRAILPSVGENFKLYADYGNNGITSWVGKVSSVEQNENGVVDRFVLLIGNDEFILSLKGSKWSIDNADIPYHYIERV